MACRSTRLPPCAQGTKPSGPTIEKSIPTPRIKLGSLSVLQIVIILDFAFKAAGNLTSPTNLHQITTGDPAFLFHSKISLLLDSHFPSGASPIPLVLNDCFLLKLGRDPSSLSYRPICLFSSLGKILERIVL
ncbi:hypothetical protein TNCV_1565961, partial [Trichonephila clavipes]